MCKDISWFLLSCCPHRMCVAFLKICWTLLLFTLCEMLTGSEQYKAEYSVFQYLYAIQNWNFKISGNGKNASLSENSWESCHKLFFCFVLIFVFFLRRATAACCVLLFMCIFVECTFIFFIFLSSCNPSGVALQKHVLLWHSIQFSSIPAAV